MSRYSKPGKLYIILLLVVLVGAGTYLYFLNRGTSLSGMHELPEYNPD